MSTYRFPAKAFDADGKHIGPGQWLDLIHETNRIDPTSFGSPDSTGSGAGDYAEEYPLFRVIHHGDETVTVAAKTNEGALRLYAAARNLEDKK